MKNKFLVLATIATGLSGCYSAQLAQIQKSVDIHRFQLSTLDSLYRYRINAISNYEKRKIDSSYLNIDDNALYERIRSTLKKRDN